MRNTLVKRPQGTLCNDNLRKFVFARPTDRTFSEQAPRQVLSERVDEWVPGTRPGMTFVGVRYVRA